MRAGWCWLRRRRSCSVLRELGGCAVGEEGGREMRNEGAGRCGRTWASYRRALAGLAAVGRALVTHGQFPRHAAATVLTGRPLNPSIQFVQK